MRIVRTFSVDKLERIQSRGKTSETKSIHCFEDHASVGFASKMCTLSPYTFRKWIALSRIYFTREFFDLRYETGNLRYEK